MSNTDCICSVRYEHAVCRYGTQWAFFAAEGF